MRQNTAKPKGKGVTGGLKPFFHLPSKLIDSLSTRTPCAPIPFKWSQATTAYRLFYALLRSFLSTKVTTFFKEPKFSGVTSSSSTATVKRSWMNTISSITPVESITLPSSATSSVNASLRSRRKFSMRKVRISCSMSVVCICR